MLEAHGFILHRDPTIRDQDQDIMGDFAFGRKESRRLKAALSQWITQIKSTPRVRSSIQTHTANSSGIIYRRQQAEPTSNQFLVDLEECIYYQWIPRSSDQIVNGQTQRFDTPEESISTTVFGLPLSAEPDSSTWKGLLLYGDRSPELLCSQLIFHQFLYCLAKKLRRLKGDTTTSIADEVGMSTGRSDWGQIWPGLGLSGRTPFRFENTVITNLAMSLEELGLGVKGCIMTLIISALHNCSHGDLLPSMIHASKDLKMAEGIIRNGLRALERYYHSPYVPPSPLSPLPYFRAVVIKNSQLNWFLQFANTCANTAFVPGTGTGDENEFERFQLRSPYALIALFQLFKELLHGDDNEYCGLTAELFQTTWRQAIAIQACHHWDSSRAGASKPKPLHSVALYAKALVPLFQNSVYRKDISNEIRVIYVDTPILWCYKSLRQDDPWPKTLIMQYDHRGSERHRAIDFLKRTYQDRYKGTKLTEKHIWTVVNQGIFEEQRILTSELRALQLHDPDAYHNGSLGPPFLGMCAKGCHIFLEFLPGTDELTVWET